MSSPHWWRTITSLSRLGKRTSAMWPECWWNICLQEFLWRQFFESENQADSTEGFVRFYSSQSWRVWGKNESFTNKIRFSSAGLSTEACFQVSNRIESCSDVWLNDRCPAVNTSADSHETPWILRNWASVMILIAANYVSNRRVFFVPPPSWR